MTLDTPFDASDAANARTLKLIIGQQVSTTAFFYRYLALLSARSIRSVDENNDALLQSPILRRKFPSLLLPNRVLPILVPIGAILSSFQEVTRVNGCEKSDRLPRTKL